MDQELVNTIDHYIAGLVAPADEVLETTLQTSVDAGMPQIHVSPVQGKLLHVLALLNGARRILEVGTLGGYSAIWLGRALPADGQLITLEHNADYAGVARANLERAGLADRVEVRVGNALQLMQQMIDAGTEPFDLVFVDADKESYSDYFQAALQLMRPGSVIVADNVIRRGAVLDATSPEPAVQAIQQFNAALAADPRVTATIMQTVGVKGLDGMAIAVVNR
jgi:predicted O-methyltransferase YrrM